VADRSAALTSVREEHERDTKLGFPIGTGVVGFRWLAFVALHHFAGI
jgi:hypothetical protein